MSEKEIKELSLMKKSEMDIKSFNLLLDYERTFYDFFDLKIRNRILMNIRKRLNIHTKQLYLNEMMEKKGDKL